MDASHVVAHAIARRRIVEKGARWLVGTYACAYRYRRAPVPHDTLILTTSVQPTRCFDSYV